MPSPLNTPTNERLPNQLWNIKIEESDELNAHPIKDNSIEDMDQKPNCNPLMTIIKEENNQSLQTIQSQHLSKSDISNNRRISRLGLNLDFNPNPNPSDNVSEGQTQTRKKTISFGANAIPIAQSSAQLIDVSIPLEKQGWFHGYISRTDAENVLRAMVGGSYLVRRCQSSKKHYSLSLKCVRGFMHIKIVEQSDGTFIFGTSNKSFNSIPQILDHYCSNRLPIRGAEHMSLLYPVIDQLL